MLGKEILEFGNNRAIVSRPQLSGGTRHLAVPLTTPSNLKHPSHLVTNEVAQGEKRIKFRSDWSDTGPTSRPDTSGATSGTTSDRLSNIFNTFSRTEPSETETNDRNSDSHFSIHYFDVPGEEDGVIDSETDQSNNLPHIEFTSDVPIDPLPSSPPPVPSMPLAPSVRQPVSWYQGHRNVRTMIKQANFWGDSHIVSGSDCGRVFFWNKWTADIELFLEADRHVVNCVQPHPLEPTLATSGIDYDIKLFSPRGGSSAISRDQLLPDLEEVLRVNEEMLEQSYTTYNVPILSLLRLMAAHRIRSGDPLEDT
ncbi:DDB1- and CUL4-associated factor 6 [Oopsacas minuta]|uniref:DDB1- and CUL4-associated factor 6 n=1 Tax=Oopsacas minuta TaxID=111878 RepID=A0AAV7K530_9METZ|nr:DDB1- and CUL4-associated factor 6 [Oopsacas minuta]KAI6656324.1 DDB1- and CUL4-associated factor 6 [Oopsacas minuta]